MVQPTVLLVEDEPAQREVLAYNLEAEGFVVQRATNGEEALMLVAENPPDLILLDWMMPHVSGLEVCRRLKMRPETRAIPIIMLSARSEEVDKVRGLETGADDYVIKPYSIIELMARLRAQLPRVPDHFCIDRRPEDSFPVVVDMGQKIKVHKAVVQWGDQSVCEGMRDLA